MEAHVLQSRYRRAGSPVLLAFGHERDGKNLRAGLLFVSAQLDDREYDLFDSEGVVTVRLPRDLVDLSEDACKLNVTLEEA